MTTSPLDTPTVLQPITERQFDQFQRLIYKSAGIHLAPHKKSLLEARLGKHIRSLGLNSFDAYYRYLINVGRDDELLCLLDRISTNETHFFREPRQFDYLANQVIPEWRARAERDFAAKRIRLWSAGCSSGEEPFSLAMTLLDHFSPHSGWQVEIIATDLSTRILERAQAALWPIEKAREIPENYLKAYMLRGTGAQSGKMKAGDEIRSLVHCQRLNLNDERYPISGPFDAIFCRNVLIYFDTASRSRVVERLINYLAPGGYLFVGHAESLTGLTNRVRHVMPTIYRLSVDGSSRVAATEREL